MFQRYTESACRVIFFARYEASQYGALYIETEHLLFGLLREDRGLSQLVLPTSSIEAIRREVEREIKLAERMSTPVEVPLTAESKRILNFAGKRRTSWEQPTELRI
jgi:ATP-dependent Clp protease ATP-binding subunit ClpC